jgi:hypothetical protein
MIRSLAMLALLAVGAPAAAGGASGSAAVSVTILSMADVPARVDGTDRKRPTGAEWLYRQVSEVDAQAPKPIPDRPHRGVIIEFQ